jgi:hypothetical protein
MAEPKIYSVTLLKEYILKKLGSPVINIEITDEQLQLAIDDALDDYMPRAYSGVQERYLPIKLIEGVSDYILPYNIFAVVEVATQQMAGIGQGLPSNMFSLNQFIAADLYRPGMAKIDLLGFEMINEMVASLEVIFSNRHTYDFNSISKILHIHGNLPQDTPAIIKVFEKMDLTATPMPAVNGIGRYAEENIYNERWIKRMSTARAQKQWGWNLIKYNGSVLPNGGTLNGQFIYDNAEVAIDKCMEELHLEFELPTDFFVGALAALGFSLPLIYQILNTASTLVT